MELMLQWNSKLPVNLMYQRNIAILCGVHYLESTNLGYLGSITSGKILATPLCMVSLLVYIPVHDMVQWSRFYVLKILQHTHV